MLSITDLSTGFVDASVNTMIASGTLSRRTLRVSIV